MRCLPALLVLPMILGFVASARAEIITTGAEFRASKHMLEHLQKYETEELSVHGPEQDKKLELAQDCTLGFQILVKDINIEQPIDFPTDSTHPVKGVWRIGYDITRCNLSKRYNTFFVAKANGESPTSRAFYPGVSLANTRLIQDTVRPALASAVAQAKVPQSCKNIAVFDMAISSNPDEKNGGAWQEIWTFKMCASLAAVEVNFTPDADGKGTSYRLHVPATH